MLPVFRALSGLALRLATPLGAQSLAPVPNAWYDVNVPFAVYNAPRAASGVVRATRRGERVRVGPATAGGWAPIYLKGRRRPLGYARGLIRSGPRPAAPSTATRLAAGRAVVRQALTA